MNTTPATNAISKLNITGNVISPYWYKNITIEKRHKNSEGVNKYPHAFAILLLGDIVYWYKNTLVIDETTGRVIEVRKKFKNDKLQRSYAQIAEMFGISYEQAKDAVRKLVDDGLITIEFRNIKGENGIVPNVMFIEPVAERIEAISFGYLEETSTENEEVGGGQMTGTSGSIEGGCGGQMTRYTYTTTKNTTNIVSSANAPEKPKKVSTKKSSLSQQEIKAHKISTWQNYQPDDNELQLITQKNVSQGVYADDNDVIFDTRQIKWHLERCREYYIERAGENTKTKTVIPKSAFAKWIAKADLKPISRKPKSDTEEKLYYAVF